MGSKCGELSFAGNMALWDQKLPNATCLLNIISDADSRNKHTLSNFAGDTELSGAVDTLEGRGGIKRDLNRLEEWVCVTLVKFNQAKCKILLLDEDNHQYQHRLGEGGTQGGIAPCGEGLGDTGG
ncbi:rna-directed dna polymerase from mobile element jockey-like [Limosa lapponica baueri]|uniref:Rna-directed dna polymerase from mobile element jockey-like n=1 Tax=Limosa lapponica baueri TaxID=1758121 RepID=A0A2I0U1K3_LIMLA|nr:rna-directed dna polymerase from mobile element jockey-like [Limosa lapponica baueri]